MKPQPRPDAADPALERQILDAVDRWVEGELRPVVQQYDLADRYPTEIVEQMKQMGLFGATIGTEYGGLGLSTRTYTRLVARICEVWMAISGIFNTHLIMAACVERCGTEEQKRHFLPRFATGELRGGLGLTEPNAGTDVQAILSRADRHGDGYRINGTKTWISNGVEGTAFAVLVRTDTEAEPRHRGMSLFICEKGEGFRVGRKLAKLGYRALDSAELIFEDFPVPAFNLIGGVEGQGFKHVMGGLELGRINIAARGVGMARGALQIASRYAQERQTFGKPIAEHQAIQLKIADMVARTRAAELLTEDAAERYDTGQRCDLEAGIAKYAASEAALKNSEEGMRILGGYSYSPDFDMERFYRDAPLLCIGEGTNEMQRIIISRQYIGRNPL